jgi:hypothetical protein
VSEYIAIMAVSLRSAEYYYATVPDRPGQAAELLRLLKEGGVELLAFSIVPTGPTHTQLWIFPESPSHLLATTKRAGLVLTGPQAAILVQGDNELGALVEIHDRLAEANINVYAAAGVTDQGDGFGYLLYVRPEDFAPAARVLGLGGSPSQWPPPPPSSRTGA